MLFVAPFRACLDRTVVKVAFLVLGIYQLFFFFTVAISIENYGVKESKFFRFRGSYTVGEQNQILDLSEIRFTYRGCESYVADTTNMSQSEINISKSIRFDGMVLKFAVSESDAHGSMAFKLLGSNDGWRTSSVAAAPDLRFAPSDVRFLANAVPFQRQVALSYRPPLGLTAFTLGHHLLWSVIGLQIGICGILKRASLARTLCIWLVAIGGAFSCASAAALLLDSAGSVRREALNPVAYILVYWVVSAVLWLLEARFFDACVFVGIASLALRALEECFAFRDCSYLLVEPPVLSILSTLYGAFLIARRRRCRALAASAAAADAVIYETQWRRVLEAERAAIGALDLNIRLLARGCGVGRPRQLNRQFRRVDPGTALSSLMSRVFSADDAALEGPDLGNLDSVAGKFDPGNPVKSLDQVYAQAAAVVYFLRPMCAWWAAQTNGALDHPPPPDAAARDSGGTARNDSADVGVHVSGGDEGGKSIGTGADCAGVSDLVAEWVKARHIKDPARAIEKLMVCYAGDASRLLDVCRARICFAGVADLHRCTATVFASAPFVHVVGVKNSLRPDYDTRLTAGYRVRPDVMASNSTRLINSLISCW